ncbi:UNVERIFIED_CONTAM: hypothetical protein PYX00_011909 [Menopon gallinae]|uniref:DNA polymerase III subunit beta n=1 Tax=Menopon gallinae TaxID=328185 RepID=A0AAW2H8U6_9NEOP
MQFECEKNLLERELSLSKHICSSREHELHSYLIMNLKESLLTLKSSNTNFSFETSLPVLEYEGGEVVINAEKLLAFLQATTQTKVHFELREGYLQLKSQKTNESSNTTRFKVVSQPNEATPSAHCEEKSRFLKLSQNRLAQLITQTSYAVSNDEYRVALTGVCVRIKDNTLHFVATDGNRLAFTVEDDCEHEDFLNILPVKGLNFLKSLMSLEGEVLINFTESRAYFQLDRYYLSMGLIAGNYPAYESIIPNEDLEEVQLDKGELLEAIKIALVMTDARSKRIFFNFSANLLTVESEVSEEGDCMSLSLSYEPSLTEEDRQASLDFLKKKRKYELEHGFSLYGPHKDQFNLKSEAYGERDPTLAHAYTKKFVNISKPCSLVAKWAGASNRYLAMAMVPSLAQEIDWFRDEGRLFVTWSLVMNEQGKQFSSSDFSVYLGPKDVSELSSYNRVEDNQFSLANLELDSLMQRGFP